MARINITQAVVKMDASEGGSLTDYSNEVMRGTLDTTRTNTKHFTFGVAAGVVSVGKYGGTLTMTIESGTTSTSLHGIFSVMATDSSPTARSFEVFIPDTTTGSHKYAFEGALTNYQLVNADAGGNGVQMHDATIEVEGVITHTVVA